MTGAVVPDWHLGPMVAFDTETTGPDPETARIVTACVALIDGRGVAPTETQTWLIDPGCEIPAEATDVHGITTEQARAEGVAPADALPEIAQALFSMPDAPLVIFNAPYDLTVMDRELRRNDIGCQPAETPRVIDPLVLDKLLDRYRRGKRTLTAACEYYGVRLDGAHDASADAVAAARLAWRLAKVHPHLARMTLAEVHDMQARAKAEQAASFQGYLQQQGKQEVIDGSWPMKPWIAEATA